VLGHADISSQNPNIQGNKFLLLEPSERTTEEIVLALNNVEGFVMWLNKSLEFHGYNDPDKFQADAVRDKTYIFPVHR
jgi:hypothetical protein